MTDISQAVHAHGSRVRWTQRLLALAISLGLMQSATSVGAAEWTNSRQLTVKGTYTDNLYLNDFSRNDDETQSDFFVELIPGIVVNGKGRNLNLGFAYAPQYVNYLSSNTDDSLNHRLQANVSSILIDDHLFLDANATARQDLIDPLGPSGDATTPNNNLQDTYSYRIAPSYRNRFGRYADLTLGFETGGVIFSDVGDDSLDYNFDLSILSGTAFGRLQWGLNASHSIIEYGDDSTDRAIDRDSDDRFSDARLSLGYQFDRRFRMDVYSGYEDNDYNSLDETSGVDWGGSMLWTPTDRTTLKLGTGKRYFGWVPQLDFSHRSKRSVWTASFIRDISDARTDRARTQVFEFEDAFGESQIPDTGQTTDVRITTSAPRRGVFISNRFNTSYTLQTRRSSVGASLEYVLREYEDGQDDEEAASARIFATRRLTGLTSANVAMGWDRRERQTSVNVDDEPINDFTFDAGFSRQLSERTSLDLMYRLRDGDEYTENRVSLSLRMAWSD